MSRQFLNSAPCCVMFPLNPHNRSGGKKNNDEGSNNPLGTVLQAVSVTQHSTESDKEPDDEQLDNTGVNVDNNNPQGVQQTEPDTESDDGEQNSEENENDRKMPARSVVDVHRYPKRGGSKKKKTVTVPSDSCASSFASSTDVSKYSQNNHDDDESEEEEEETDDREAFEKMVVNTYPSEQFETRRRGGEPKPVPKPLDDRKRKATAPKKKKGKNKKRKSKQENISGLVRQNGCSFVSEADKTSCEMYCPWMEGDKMIADSSAVVKKMVEQHVLTLQIDKGKDRLLETLKDKLSKVTNAAKGNNKQSASSPFAGGDNTNEKNSSVAELSQENNPSSGDSRKVKSYIEFFSIMEFIEHLKKQNMEGRVAEATNKFAGHWFKSLDELIAENKSRRRPITLEQVKQIHSTMVTCFALKNLIQPILSSFMLRFCQVRSNDIGFVVFPTQSCFQTNTGK